MKTLIAYAIATGFAALYLCCATSGCHTGQGEVEISTPAVPKPEHTLSVRVYGQTHYNQDYWHDCTMPQEVKSNIWVFTNFSYTTPRTITVIRPTTLITITE